MCKHRLSPIFGVVFIFLFSCNWEATWHGVVYPNKTNLRDSIEIGKYDSLCECGAAAIVVLERLGSLQKGDYECGRNCKRNKNLPTLWDCKDTTRANIPLDLAKSYFPRDSSINAIQKFYIRNIFKIYNPDFLTYPGMLKYWYVQIKVSLDIQVSRKMSQYVRARSQFVEAVTFLGVTSAYPPPTLSMGPTAFKVYFNGLAEDMGMPLRLEN